MTRLIFFSSSIRFFFVMEAPRRITEEHIRLSGLRRRNGIIDHSRRIGAFLSADHIRACTVRPLPELLACCRTECIRGGDHDFLPLALQLSCKLTDGGRLAHAVHTDHNTTEVRSSNS